MYNNSTPPPVASINIPCRILHHLHFIAHSFRFCPNYE